MDENVDYIGPSYLLANSKVAILNSRQSKYPIGSDSWIIATRKAMGHAREKGVVIVTSLGMNTWELVLAYAARLGLGVIIVIPDQTNDRQVLINGTKERFRLANDRVGFVFSHLEDKGRKKSLWPKRDREIVRLADSLWPISIRPDGTLRKLLETGSDKVNRSFAVPYDKPSRVRPRYELGKLNPLLQQEKLVVHFTRSVSEPWPDESAFDFYDAIVGSKDTYCRSAENTLFHILHSGIIYASRKNIRGGFAVAAFSQVTEENVASLFRYRSRLVNPYFEPYGIALPEEVALSAGLRPVIYGKSDDYDCVNNEQKVRFQNAGRYGEQWRTENEWRATGDFHLSRVPVNNLRVIVPTPANVERASCHTQLNIIPLSQ